MNGERKGQLSVYVKPLVIAAFIFIFALVIYNMVRFNLGVVTQANRIKADLSGRTIYLNIVRCLAQNRSSYPYVLNISKLEKYNNSYRNKNPPCIKEYRYGWNTTVKLFRNNKSWSFGQFGSSMGDSLERERLVSFPIAIRKNPYEVHSGKVYIQYREGDLETVAGSINEVYDIGKSEGKADKDLMIKIDNPLSYKGNKVCSRSTKESCVQVRGKAVENISFKPGEYSIDIVYSSGKDGVLVTK